MTIHLRSVWIAVKISDLELPGSRGHSGDMAPLSEGVNINGLALLGSVLEYDTRDGADRVR